MKKILLVGLVLATLVLSGLPVSQASAATSLATSLKGRILLQVEEHGEAWYVYPVDSQRYYLGRPQEAFDIMRKLGLGVSNADLNKIPIGLTPMAGADSDGDGLSNDFEKSQGMNIYSTDSDKDGYGDKLEILNNYSPIYAGTVKNYVDKNLVSKLSGRILLQVQSKGEAWYLDPVSQKRYYLGRPADAFTIMRSFGLGITNDNLAKIEVGSLGSKCDCYSIVCPAGYHAVTNNVTCTKSCVKDSATTKSLSLTLNSTGTNSAVFKLREYLNGSSQVIYTGNYQLYAGTTSSNMTTYYLSNVGAYAAYTGNGTYEITPSVYNMPTGYYYFQLVNKNTNLKSNILGVSINNSTYNKQITLSLNSSTSNSATFKAHEYLNNSSQVMYTGNYEMLAGTSSTNLTNYYLGNVGAYTNYSGNSTYEVTPYVYSLPTGYYYFQLANKVNGVKSNVVGVQITNNNTYNRQLTLSADSITSNSVALDAREYLNNSSEVMYNSNYELRAGTSSSYLTTSYLSNLGASVTTTGNSTYELTKSITNLPTGYYYFQLVNTSNGVSSNVVGVQITNVISENRTLTLSLNSTNDTSYATFNAREYNNNVSQIIYTGDYELWAGFSTSTMSNAFLSNVSYSGNGSYELSSSASNLPSGNLYFQLVKKNSTLKSNVVNVFILHADPLPPAQLNLSLVSTNSSTASLKANEYIGSTAQTMNWSNYELRGGASSTSLSTTYFNGVGATASIYGGSTAYEITAQILNLPVGTHYVKLVNKSTNIQSNIVTVTINQVAGVKTMDLVYKGKYNGMLIFESKNYINGVSQTPKAASQYAIAYANSGLVPVIQNSQGQLNYEVEFAFNVVRFMVKDFNQKGTFQFQTAMFDGTPYSSNFTASNILTVTLQ